MAADSAAGAAGVQAAKPEEVRAVMFFVTVDKNTGIWTHAQVIGGYKDNDACRRAVPNVKAAASSSLAATDIPIFLCPTIDSAMIKAQQKSEQQRNQEDSNAEDSEAPALPLLRGDVRPPLSTNNL